MNEDLRYQNINVKPFVVHADGLTAEDVKLFACIEGCRRVIGDALAIPKLPDRLPPLHGKHTYVVKHEIFAADSHEPLAPLPPNWDWEYGRVLPPAPAPEDANDAAEENAAEDDAVDKESSAAAG